MNPKNKKSTFVRHLDNSVQYYGQTKLKSDKLQSLSFRRFDMLQSIAICMLYFPIIANKSKALGR